MPADSRPQAYKFFVLAYVVAAIIILALSARDVENALLWLHDFSRSASMFALGIAAVAFASFGPFALSLWCWRLTGCVHRRWVVHLLFIPCAWAMVYAGASLLDFADGRSWTDEPADYALMAAVLLLGLTVLAHVTALIVELVAAIRRYLAGDR